MKKGQRGTRRERGIYGIGESRGFHGEFKGQVIYSCSKRRGLKEKDIRHRVKDRVSGDYVVFKGRKMDLRLMLERDSRIRPKGK